MAKADFKSMTKTEVHAYAQALLDEWQEDVNKRLAAAGEGVISDERTREEELARARAAFNLPAVAPEGAKP